MRIDIWSDVVCPWCWIGKHRFQRGLDLLGPGAPAVEVHWHPFQLDPDAGTDPVPLRQAYAAKFGGPERTEQILSHTQSTARAEGLPMDFSRGQVRVTTLPAHRLMCDSLYEDEQELWLMGNLDDAAWVYALENATGTETDHSNPPRDDSFIATRDACTTEACLCEALIEHTNGSLGGESPYPQ